MNRSASTSEPINWFPIIPQQMLTADRICTWFHRCARIIEWAGVWIPGISDPVCIERGLVHE